MTAPDLLIRMLGVAGLVDDEPGEWLGVGPLDPDERSLSGSVAFRCATSPPALPPGDSGDDTDEVCA